MRSLNILIIDDEPLVREKVRDMLHQENHRVATCCCGIEALHKLRGDGIDLVITEYWLPGTSGGELAAIAKNQSIPRRVILMTSHLPRQELPCVDAVLLKPFSLTQLRHAIEEVMTPREKAA
jgi:two-component system phosphate regulon response regulator PhoB